MSGLPILRLNAIFKRAVCLPALLCLWPVLSGAPAQAQTQNSRLLVLCYHDIPHEVHLDKYGVDEASFVSHIEYLRTHGYHFVSVDDCIQANKGGKQLPEKAVLLTFDDAYESFYTFVYPLLKLYGYPSVLSVVTSWIDSPPEHLPSKLMTWQQIAEVARNGSVEVASHTHDLHKAIPYNPYGNTGWAATSRLYDTATKTYESEQTFRTRIADDIALSAAKLKADAGVDVRVLTWPYGRYNQIGIEAARDIGMKLCMDISDNEADTRSLYPLTRIMIVDNPSIQEFISGLKEGFQRPVKQRVVQIDLDTIYDVDPAHMEGNLNALIDRLYTMKVSAVYLQAFCDDKGTGNIASVYFPNRVLPMKADIFNRVVNQIAIRDIEVYAWMPTLNIILPEAAENEALLVKEWDTGAPRTTFSRLSPFSQNAVDKLRMLYEDMALNARIDGVVFLDDCYLSESEDFNPAAMEVYKKAAGSAMPHPLCLAREASDRWTNEKIGALNALTVQLADTVRRFRPRAKFVRTLYAATLTDPESGRKEFSQDFAQSLAVYDYVNVMAYPRMENIRRPAAWLQHLVDTAKTHPDGAAKTVFKLQAYDWGNKRWLSTSRLKSWMRTLVARGALHIGYYPDGCIMDQPENRTIRTMMSVEDFPFERRPQENGLYQ